MRGVGRKKKLKMKKTPAKSKKKSSKKKAAKKSTAIRNSTTMSDTEGNSDAEYDKPKKTKGQDGAGGDGAPNKLKAKVEDKSALTEEDFISIKFDREWPMII